MKQPAIKHYEDCATRLENRGAKPPTRDYVDRLVEGIDAAGIEACWHSAVDANGRPLFKSKVYPNCSPDADTEAFLYLTDKLHSIGRPVISWYPLQGSMAVFEAHPEWHMVPLKVDGVPDAHCKGGEDRTCCLNSPYKELLGEFVAEIVRDLNFDGIWFDGSTLTSGGIGVPACLCDFCKKRFRDDTGLDLPTKYAPDSRDFRIWVNWRYDCLMEAWKHAVDSVLAVRKDATVAFNNIRRLHRGIPPWIKGIPIRKLGWNAMIAGEIDMHTFHADFQMKMHRAYGCNKRPETWIPMCDHWACWVPDVEPLPIQQAAIGAANAGGTASMGIAVHPRVVTGLLKSVEDTVSPLMPFLEGDTVEYAAIWCSQQTQDFYDISDSTVRWTEYHGANELCLHSHLQSSVVFDDHVSDGDISRYPVLIAGNTACVSKKQAEKLEEYVENGGVLLTCFEFGTRDELGFPYEKPIMDDFIGLKSRTESHGMPTLEMRDSQLEQSTGKWLSFFQSKAKCQQHCVPECSANAHILADLMDRVDHYWEDAPGKTTKFPRYPGVWKMNRGKGCVIYTAVNIPFNYIWCPTPHMLRFFRTLVTSAATPRVTLDAPMQVSMNTRVDGKGRLIVMLHDAPGSLYRHPGCEVFNSGELVPIMDIAVRLEGMKALGASSGLSGDSFTVVDNGSGVLVPRLDRNDVIVIDLMPA